ncbi:MAG TPA: hypothetical protein ENN51_07200 [candidate division WOR-3 bacterium]|uniref:Soluble ligand binding domain-containing protein n=1 Tax=candidate division WOR-3 bacterium TaxID=2052148 RepID=A0A7V0T6F2_UNCW3|nr:hypothetical protein [candidate division WOR-3 bacterium]
MRNVKTVLAVLFAAVALVAAHSSGSRAAASVAGREPAPGTVRASVWGAVTRPGQYRLAGAPDVLELMSAAGGPSADADLGRVLLIREVDGSRHRLDIGRFADAEPLFLVSGDVLIVPEHFWRKVQRSLPLVTTLVTLANLAVTITLLAR